MSVKQKGQLISWIEEACTDGARQRLTCGIVGISAQALQRWKAADSLVDKRQTTPKRPAN
ncbi:hypothetical protein H4J46_16760 [Colwellia sp. MB02u-6]|uniref:hypothetical protein n=1 Tax=Colwellia sp. MB02u-6 TaxID=2759824 RepID=UPI0015F5B529|nr:hypothetical protein [Colwellia sp. MB02u-6]MBA6329563.1 hypothetical protein [Colwellia sp. MB02u-6]